MVRVVQRQPDHQLGRLPACPARQRAPRRRVLRTAALRRGNKSSCSNPSLRLRCALCRSRMGLSPILVMGDPSCARRRGFTQRPRHERCESGQRAEIHLGALLNAHPGAGHAVEHPERNFLPETRDSPVHGTSRASDARPLYVITNPDTTTAPGMPRIQDRPRAGPMGGLALACTTRSAHMAAWDTGRRLRRRSSCQAGRPAPLRSTGHPAWPANLQCTNIQPGPADGGRSLEADRAPEVPRKQRHTAYRIFERLRDEPTGQPRSRMSPCGPGRSSSSGPAGRNE